MLNCPGNSWSRKKPSEMVKEIKCEYCGNELELWYDETKVRCNKCLEYNFKDIEDLLKDFQCANWCNDPESCLGPKTYRRFKEAQKSFHAGKKGQLEEKID